ncbi:hypothetical protein HNQ80_005192 [Anaerosolibacter carboniphilus]|uniref:Uncharacterized protein n=1 Tax=Anaerosolibacter carboniphilus TaxID=1417629 RepID=A0A841KZH2_9FIRM|nr:hypothetical protein [Anaerosolibacter carboniphilus]MBB6219014.1 hypothetical protein [Anaerosolibacter carboniphilus]
MKTSLWLNDPEWFKEKKKMDMERPHKEGQKWTREDDIMAIELFKTGNYTHKQIGDLLGRSGEGVQRRLSRLDVWGTGEYIPPKRYGRR